MNTENLVSIHLPVQYRIGLYGKNNNISYRNSIVSCCRLWWEAGHEGHLQELKLKRRDQRKGYVIKVQEVVGVTVQQNLRHIQLQIC
jgi:hypothetical protein